MLRRITLSLTFLVLANANLTACNIPVFRYALERWHPDKTQIVAFADDSISEQDKQFLKTLKEAAGKSDRPTNTDFVEVEPNTRGEHAKLWSNATTTSPPTLPYFVSRSKVKGHPVSHWRGEGTQAAKDAKLLDSPARQELHKRLLKGDSIVWILLKSQDKQKNAEVKKTLTDTFAKLETELKLPDGIGEPGSELYADVPLLLNFSILEIEPTDKGEAYLRNLLSSFHPDAAKDGTPLVAPVFGRGRVLEVLPADTVDGNLVKELTVFLCGACSCKVKGLNPGFDLLMSANWDDDLFGVDGERPNDTASSDETPLPTLIAIPPGRKKQRD